MKKQQAGSCTRPLPIPDEAPNLKHGTLYPALVRLEQRGWTRGFWGRAETDERYDAVTKAGFKAIEEGTVRWQEMAAVVAHLRAEE